jgi:hypothetical protein
MVRQGLIPFRSACSPGWAITHKWCDVSLGGLDVAFTYRCQFIYLLRLTTRDQFAELLQALQSLLKCDPDRNQATSLVRL